MSSGYDHADGSCNEGNWFAAAIRPCDYKSSEAFNLLSRKNLEYRQYSSSAKDYGNTEIKAIPLRGDGQADPRLQDWHGSATKRSRSPISKAGFGHLRASISIPIPERAAKLE